MIPFLCSGAGGSQVNRRADEFTGVALKLKGGPLGTGLGAIYVSIIE